MSVQQLTKEEWMENHKRLTGKVILAYYLKNYSEENQAKYVKAYEDLIAFVSPFTLDAVDST